MGIKLNKFYFVVLLVLLSLFIRMQYAGYAIFSTPNGQEVNHDGPSSSFYHK